MKKKILLLFSFILSVFTLSAQNADIFQTYIILNIDNTGNQFFAGGINADGATSYTSVNLGSPTSFELKGGEIKTFKNGGANVTSAEINYRVYKQGDTPSSFTSINLPFDSDLGGGDQKWKMENEEINLISAASGSGTFVLEIFWKISTSVGDKFDSDFGNNFTNTFSKSTVPVKLETFSGEQIKNTVLLKWNVLSEINNYFFTIEKKVRGEWQSIGTIYYKYGRSSNLNYYQFHDSNPTQGENLYRLTQTDYDDTTTELGIESVHFQQLDISIYPNPFINLINIKLPQSNTYQTRIIDMAGKVINNHSFRGDFYQLDLQGIAPGQYHLNIMNQDEKIIHSSIISKLR